jgi:hypothetical protein
LSDFSVIELPASLFLCRIHDAELTPSLREIVAVPEPVPGGIPMGPNGSLEHQSWGFGGQAVHSVIIALPPLCGEGRDRHDDSNRNEATAMNARESHDGNSSK